LLVLHENAETISGNSQTVKDAFGYTKILAGFYRYLQTCMDIRTDESVL
jgi:hypothetical protein